MRLGTQSVPASSLVPLPAAHASLSFRTRCLALDQLIAHSSPSSSSSFGSSSHAVAGTSAAALVHAQDDDDEVLAAPQVHEPQQLELDEAHERQQHQRQQQQQRATDSQRVMGLARGRALELSGPPGSGKSLVALSLALDAASNPAGSEVLLVDTEGSLSPALIAKVTRRRGLPASVLQRIHYYRLDRLALLLAFLRALDPSLRAGLVPGGATPLSSLNGHGPRTSHARSTGLVPPQPPPREAPPPPSLPMGTPLGTPSARRTGSGARVRLLIFDSLSCLLRHTAIEKLAVRTMALALARDAFAKALRAHDISVVVTTRMSLKWFSPDGDRQAFFSGADALLLPLVPLDDQLVVETQPPLVTRVLLYFDNDGSRLANTISPTLEQQQGVRYEIDGTGPVDVSRDEPF